VTQTRSVLTRADGTRLAWDAAGDGPVVLLVHGIGSSRRKWEPQVGPLVASGYRVVRFDLRGFGDSETPAGPHGMNDFVGDLVAFADGVGLERFHLVGHSLGGMIAQRYAIERPARVRSLALVSTTSHNGRRATAFARLMVTLAEHGFDNVLNDSRLRQDAEAILGEAFPAGTPLSMLRRGMEQPNLARANAWRACIDFSTKDRLGELRCPALVAHGTADMLIPFRAGELVARAIPGAAWLVEQGAGHSLPQERAESFTRALSELLQKASES
jgi:pimeloyl-ACP methyl ester carboxylesterase